MTRLEKPLSRKELEKLDRMLASPKVLETVVEQAVKGRKLERTRETAKATRRIRKHA